MVERLTTDQKVPGSNPGWLDPFLEFSFCSLSSLFASVLVLTTAAFVAMDGNFWYLDAYSKVLGRAVQDQNFPT